MAAGKRRGSGAGPDRDIHAFSAAGGPARAMVRVVAHRAEYETRHASDGRNLYFVERNGFTWNLAHAPANGGPSSPIPTPFKTPTVFDIDVNRAETSAGQRRQSERTAIMGFVHIGRNAAAHRQPHRPRRGVVARQAIAGLYHWPEALYGAGGWQRIAADSPARLRLPGLATLVAGRQDDPRHREFSTADYHRNLGIGLRWLESPSLVA